jgi:hypothetical protein
MSGYDAGAGAAGTEVEGTRSWWRGLWIYGVMVIAALVGIGYTSTGGPAVDGSGPRLIWVWGAIIPIYFAACVWHGWEYAATRQGRFKLVATQALHWLAFLAAMHVLQMREVRGVLNDDADGVTLLILLALGTFLAGVHAWSLPICLTGIVLGLSIPLIAWIEQTAVLLVLLVLAAAAAGAALWVLRRRAERALPE